MAFSINGFGTTFYGKAAREPDGSFITTKWLIFSYLPIIPLASMRLRYASQDEGFFSTGTNYHVIMDYPLDILQVIRTWAYVALLFTVMLRLEPESKSHSDLWRLVATILLPHVLRMLARFFSSSGPAKAPPQRKAGAARTRLEDLPRVSTCPKCRYTRKPDDYAPAWQCPSCKVAYNKVSQYR